MRETSLKAFAAIQDKLPASRGKVFGALYAADEPLCDYQIALALKTQHHCVTPRRLELLEMGYISSAGVKVGPPYNQEVEYWQINPGALEAGFVPRPVKRYARKQRREISVHEAAMVLVAHRRMKRQQKRAADKLPLFG
jgi:hypothetical protein